MSWATLLTVLSVLSGNAIAQQSPAQCMKSYSWAINTRGQTPCIVAAYLSGICTGGQFTVPAIRPKDRYVSPTPQSQNECVCSTVVYSLMAACAACQNGTYDDYSVWSKNCTGNIFFGVFRPDLPGGTAVPGWAYQDLATTNRFNPSIAQAHAHDLESTAIPKPSPIPSDPGSSTSSSSSLSSAAAANTQTTMQSATGKSDAGPIAGGVVGGVVVVLAAVALITWMLVRRRKLPRTVYALSEHSGYTQTPGFAPSTRPPLTQRTTDSTIIPRSPLSQRTTDYAFPAQSRGASPQKFYDPSDPSTFPVLGAEPTIRTTYSSSANPDFSDAPPLPPGRFTGSPEV